MTTDQVLKALKKSFYAELKDLGRGSARGESLSLDEEKEELLLPPTIFEEEQLELRLKNHFGSASHMLILSSFSVFTIYAFATAESNQFFTDAQVDSTALFALVGLSIMCLLGGFYLYSFLVGCFNKTKFKLNNGRLMISRGPFPGYGGIKEVLVGDLTQAYVEVYRSRGMKGPMEFFRLILVTRQGLVTGQTRFASYEDALTAEVWVERKLNIADVVVEKECKWKKRFKVTYV